MSRPVVHLALACFLNVLAACSGRPAIDGELSPLVDERHVPDVLTESRALAPPPSLVGNRFIRGWRFLPPEEAIRIVPDPAGSRLEIVHLEARPRTLRLTLPHFPAGGELALRVAGRDSGRWPLAGTREIPLPADLPLGRVPLDLVFPRGTRLALEGSGLREAHRPGGVEINDDGTLVQAPWSLVDLVREVAAQSVLHGVFVPPEDAGKSQEFGLALERQGGRTPRELFTWKAAEDGGRGRRFSLPLGSLGGLVRVRLAARGSGPPGRWQELAVETPRSAPAVSAAQAKGALQAPSAPRVIVVYVLDALRASHVDHLSGAGRGATPAIDQLAAEGVTFTRHLSVAPNTTPSTKSLFTGQYFLLRGREKLPADGAATLADLFARAGYRTGGFSGNGNLSRSHGTIRGFERFVRSVPEERRLAHPYNDDAERVHKAALRWLDDLGGNERAFLYVHTIHPHNPFNPPEPFRGRFLPVSDSTINGSTSTLLKIRSRKLEVDAEDGARLEGLYTGGLAYNDALLRPFLDEVVRRHPPGEVLVVLTSDHGEELFEHGGILHGYTLYDEMLHVPLVFWWPGRLAPGRVDAATDNLDLHATLRSLTGAQPSALDLGESRPLWDLLLDPRARQGPGKRLRFAAAASVEGGIFMARSADAKLIWAPRAGVQTGMGAGLGRTWDPEYLFDLRADPGELVNRAGDDWLEAAWLRSRLLAWIERGKQIEIGEEVVLDEETRDNLQALGYLD